MDYLKPPTDNLYKFAAISGLVVLGVSLYFPDQMIHELNQAKLEHTAKVRESGTEYDYALLTRPPDTKETDRTFDAQFFPDMGLNEPWTEEQREASRLQYMGVQNETLEIMTLTVPELKEHMQRERSRNRVFDITRVPIADIKRIPDLEAGPELDRIVAALRETAAAKRKVFGALEIGIEEQWYNDDRTRNIRSIARAGIGAGLALMIYGFLFWLVKVQRYQDALLVAEAKEKGVEPGSIFPWCKKKKPATSQPLNLGEKK